MIRTHTIATKIYYVSYHLENNFSRLYLNFCFRGEAAFCTLAHYFFWAKVPFVNRINELDPNIPLTAVYGGNSWMPSLTRQEFEDARNGEGYCRVRVKYYL